MSTDAVFLPPEPGNSLERILVLGDSHAGIFKHGIIQQAFPSRTFIVYAAGGATASGLENPNVQVKAYERFLEAVKTERCQKVIISLGEVDTGFVIWYRVEKFGADLTLMLERTVEAYTRFLQQLAGHCQDLIVYSAPLPTIEDGNDWGGVANLRREIQASQVERTALTLRFNQKVEAYCGYHDITFINLDSECLGENGIVKAGMMNKDPRDHHYDEEQYALLLMRRLNGVI
jgi:hypothetical protein